MCGSCCCCWCCCYCWRSIDVHCGRPFTLIVILYVINSNFIRAPQIKRYSIGTIDHHRVWERRKQTETESESRLILFRSETFPLSSVCVFIKNCLPSSSYVIVIYFWILWNPFNNRRWCITYINNDCLDGKLDHHPKRPGPFRHRCICIFNSKTKSTISLALSICMCVL